MIVQKWHKNTDGVISTLVGEGVQLLYITIINLHTVVTSLQMSAIEGERIAGRERENVYWWKVLKLKLNCEFCHCLSHSDSK